MEKLLSPNDIGIITPYARQAGQINRPVLVKPMALRSSVPTADGRALSDLLGAVSTGVSHSVTAEVSCFVGQGD